MREFKAISGDFHRRTSRRMILGVVVLIAFTICFWANWPIALPRWVELSALTAVVLFLAAELLSYRKAKAIAETFSIKLFDDSLAFSHEGGGGRLPYGDLRISKVKRRDGEVVEIHLRTIFRQTIKLRGLENMRELHASLAKHVAQLDQESS